MKITEFDQNDTEEVKTVIYKTLEFVKADARRSLGQHIDADLDKIPEVYNGRGRFWVAKEDGKIIGTIAVKEVDQHTAKLKRMFVLPEFHGTGVGQALLDTAINFAKENTYKKITLNTSPKMHRAHHFYEKNGFTQIKKYEDSVSYELIF